MEIRPAQPFHIAGDSLSLSCQADGLPNPTVEWSFDGEKLPGSSGGVLNLTGVQTSQGGMYTCSVINPETKKERQESIDVNIFGEYVAICAPLWLFFLILGPELMSQHVKMSVFHFEVELLRRRCFTLSSLTKYTVVCICSYLHDGIKNRQYL